jgi:hypothetical protein
MGHPAMATEVYINEMSARQPGTQWIEFYNASDEWVDLNDGNWRLEWNDSVYDHFDYIEVMGPGEYGIAAFDHPATLKGVANLIETVRSRDSFTGPGDRVGGEDIATAVVIASIPYVDTGNTCGYLDDYEEACPYAGSTAPDVVYAYSPPSDIPVDIDLCGSSYDTKVFVYENMWTPGNPYACNDDYYDVGDPCGNWVSKIEQLTLVAGNIYYIVVDGYNIDCGDYRLEISVAALRDGVSYGGQGSAPVPPAGMTLARVPDASNGTPPPPDSANDGLVWTIDPTHTFGLPNDAPPPAFPSFHYINELDPSPVGGNDLVELYNWTADPVDVNGWFLVGGDSTVAVTGVIPAGDFLTLLTGPGVDLETSGVIYLFDADEARIDQLGFHDAPALGLGECYGRCPDGGDDFYLGYDYESSGGNHALLPLTCSPGCTNWYACLTSDVEEPFVPYSSQTIMRIRPNPFGHRAAIHFDLPEAEVITLHVYDAAGRLVRRLIDGSLLPGGHHESVWTGVDDAGRVVSSGMYFVRLNSSRQGVVKRMVLLK